MPGVGIQLLDTTPKWLGLTLVCSACALVVTGIGILVNQLILFSITPFSLLLHFALAISLSAWILNLRIQMTPDRKPVLAIGIAVAVGSIWSSLQQFFFFKQKTAYEVGLGIPAEPLFRSVFPEIVPSIGNSFINTMKNINHTRSSISDDIRNILCSSANMRRAIPLILRLLMN